MNRYIPVLTSLALAALFSGSVPGADQKAAPESVDYIKWQAAGYAIAKPLGSLTGDPAVGRKLVVDRKKGNCIACHLLPVPEAEFPGTVGPPLVGIAHRLSEGELRLRVVDIKQLFPHSIMPGYYRNPENYINVKKKFRGKTILSPQEVEDIVAWLTTLQ